MTLSYKSLTQLFCLPTTYFKVYIVALVLPNHHPQIPHEFGLLYFCVNKTQPLTLGNSTFLLKISIQSIIIFQRMMVDGFTGLVNHTISALY